MNIKPHTITVPVEIEVEVSVKASQRPEFKQTLYEPGEPGGYNLESYTISGKGVRQEIKEQCYTYLDDNWTEIEHEIGEADQAAYDDYKFEQHRDRQNE